MIRLLREVTLRSGEMMHISLVTPPVGEYAEALLHFLEHKDDQTLRGIRQRIRGAYADICDDRFVVGMIDGEIAGQLWYGFPRQGSGVANFGEVYTEPKHRRKGITTLLMDDFASDFAASSAVATFCNCSRLHIAKIYMGKGFRYALPGDAFGALALVKEGCGDPEGFAALEAEYYRLGEPLTVGLGSMVHRHDVDKLLRLAFQMRGGCPERLGPGARVGSYADALFMCEDGRGIVAVATTPARHVMGWAFFLNTGAASEQCTHAFDYELHPNYAAVAEDLLADWLQLARAQGIERIFAYSSAIDNDRRAVLAAAGFQECARLPEACMCGNAMVDEVVHRWTAG